MMSRTFKSILALIAVVAGTFCVWLVGHWYTPYKFDVKTTIPKKEDGFYLYHDFDHDGVSEFIYGANDFEYTHFRIGVRDTSGAFVDQCNYKERIRYAPQNNWLYFADYNHDDMDEVFGFTQKGDSLFLYIHDLVAKRVVEERKLVATLPRENSLDEPFAKVVIAGLIELDNDELGIVFSALPLRAEMPRGIYVYNVTRMTMHSQFISGAYTNWLYLYDLTGDGKDEIVAIGQGMGNIHYETTYDDNKSRLFVFDNNLNPIFEPLEFGGYPSRLQATPCIVDGERRIFIYYFYLGHKNHESYMSYVDSEGKLSGQRSNRLQTHMVLPPAHMEDSDSPEFFSWYAPANFIRMNSKFQITTSAKLAESQPQQATIRDLDGDGQSEVIYYLSDGILVLDSELNILARHHTQEPSPTVSYAQSGQATPLRLGVATATNFDLLAFETNTIYDARYMIGVLAGLVVALVVASTWYGIQRFSRRTGVATYVQSSLPYGRIICDRSGRVIEMNNRAHAILNESGMSTINRVSELSQFFSAADVGKVEAFIQDYPDSSVEDRLENQVGDRYLELSVVPIKRRVNSKTNYFCIELHDITTEKRLAALQEWSRTLQAMAHNVKKPLSTARMSFAVLQKHLEQANIGENVDIQRQLSVILNKLNEAQQEARKLVNIDDPKFASVRLKQLLYSVKAEMSGQLSRELQIHVDVDERVDTIYADEIHINLAFANLIDNSAVAMNGSGVIQIEAFLARDFDNHDERLLQIMYRDNGPGIPLEIRERIFEPRVTTKTQGDGVGMVIVKQIIESHGGTIELLNGDAEGVEFRITLPAHNSTMTSK